MSHVEGTIVLEFLHVVLQKTVDLLSWNIFKDRWVTFLAKVFECFQTSPRIFSEKHLNLVFELLLVFIGEFDHRFNTLVAVANTSLTISNDSGQDLFDSPCDDLERLELRK